MNSDVVITGATLLTLEQASELPQNILMSNERWWLKTPGYTKSTVTQVYKEGVVDEFGSNVELCYVGIRPVLLVNPDSEFISTLRFGKRTNLCPKDGMPVSFIYIGTDADGYGMLMSERCIAKGQFRTDWKSDNANDYISSDAKQKVDSFFEMMKCCTVQAEQSFFRMPEDNVSADKNERARRWQKRKNHRPKKHSYFADETYSIG